MTYVVELPVGREGEPEQAVSVEIEHDGDGLVTVARSGQVVARASRSLRAALATSIRPLAEDFVEGFRGMADAPDEIGIEFGLSLSAEADVVVARAAGVANFKVSLTWHRPAADAEVPVLPVTASTEGAQ
ncbi:MAG TPA: CU044_2847 family protein [Streptosporangiaceae bacterium]|nr:CU044_2847 family protein [Streptosporangiaceae bacterium]